jgi:bacterioferritin (cytochrome b1)
MMKKSGQREKHRALNTDLGLEIGVIIQYMHHHVMAKVWKASDNARADVMFLQEFNFPFSF